MAKTVKELERELRKATELARKTYDVLKPPLGNSGILLDKEYKKAVAEQDKKRIAELKPLYDKALAAYTKAQNEKNAINKELKAAQKKEDEIKKETAKNKAAQSSYDKAVKDLAKAEAGIAGYKGQDNYITAYQEVIAAADMLKTAGGKPAPLPKPKVVIPPAVQGTGSGTGTGATGATGATGPEPGISKVLEGLADPKQKETLIKIQKALAKDFGYKGTTDGQWSYDFQTTLENVYKNRLALPKTLQGASLLKFVLAPTVDTSKVGGTGGPTTVKSVTNLTDAEIEEMVNKSALNLLGREINDKDKTAGWYKSLSKAVKDMAKEGSVTKYSGGGSGTQSNVTTPGYTPEKAAQTIESGLKKAAPTDLARKERVDFTSWMFQQLGGSNG
jgi:hypothetical protein